MKSSMLVNIALYLIFAHVIIISVRLCLWKSGRKWLLHLLTLAWIACLLSAATLMAADASKTYVAPNKVYKGYWYNKDTGGKIRNEYDMVGGKGTSPVGTFIMFSLSFLVIGFIIGSSVAMAKDKADERTAIHTKVFIFAGYLVLYIILGWITVGLYPFFTLNRNKFPALNKKGNINK